jgi:hypothetical protein
MVRRAALGGKRNAESEPMQHDIRPTSFIADRSNGSLPHPPRREFESRNIVRMSGFRLRMFFLALISLMAMSADVGEARGSETTDAARQSDAGHEAVQDRDAEKQQKAMIALMALCGILIGGLAFVVLVIVWGSRLRRIARAELPEQKTLQNDLWFLKPPKPPAES